MKILTFSNCPLNESQGSGYVVLNYTRGLRVLGHHVDLLGPESFELFRFFRFGKRHRQAIGIVIQAVFRILFGNYDIIEFYGADSCLAAKILNHWPGRRFLLVSHSNGVETHAAERITKYLGHTTVDGLPPRFHQRMLRLPMEWAFRSVDAIVTVSKNDADYVLNAGYQPESHVLALNNSLPAIYLNQQVDFVRGRRLGFCGSWLPNKGCKIMQEAIPQILLKYPDATFTLIGVGDNFASRDYFPTEVLDRIHVIPFVADRVELLKLYHSISIILLPSIYESFGLVSAEALSCGCALVATKTGFAASLNHLENAFILTQPDPSLLIAGVGYLLDKDELRQRIAQNGYQCIQGLHWSGAIAQLEKSYLQWLETFRQKR